MSDERRGLGETFEFHCVSLGASGEAWWFLSVARYGPWQLLIRQVANWAFGLGNRPDEASECEGVSRNASEPVSAS